MAQTPSIDYDALTRSLAEAGAVTPPAEVHGTLCGLLCADADAATASAVPDVDDPGLEGTLHILGQSLLEGLLDPDFGFAPLLPDDDWPLETRVQALAQWCDGFVFGIAGNAAFDFTGASEDVREVVTDLTELSKAGLTTADDSDERGESDYAELVEYVRVGVQLIFLELRSGSAAEPAARLH